MPDLSVALDRRLVDETGVMKEPVSGEALHLGESVGRNLIVEVLVSREGVDRVTRVSETFRLRVDSVHDTMTDRWLTLDDAVDTDIVVPAHGEYVDRRRGIHIPLIDAVGDNLIQGRLLDVERRKEEVTRMGDEWRMADVRSSCGATSAVVSDDELPLAISVRRVVDPLTGLQLSVKEAVDAGIFDAATGEFIDVNTGERLSLERAIALNLVVADSDEQADEMVAQQTYGIGAVLDPVSGKLISPRQAVDCGLLDMARGIYIYPMTEEAITLAEALERGLIRAEPLEGAEILDVAMKTTTTSKVEHSRMVFTIKRVKDLSTGEIVGLEEAMKRGILDTVKGLYIDSRNGNTMLLYDAYKAGLIEAAETVPQMSSPVQSATQSLARRSFNIVAVIDPGSNAQLSVAEAVDRHLLDAALCQFVDLYNNEVMSVEEAVSRGYVIVDYDPSGPGPTAAVHTTQSYRIKSVIDSQTREEIPLADAVRHKIVDKASGMYWNMRTDEMIPIDEAIRLGLVITESVDAQVTKRAQVEIGDDFAKQVYMLTAVKDPRTGKEFDPVEAERRGLINKLQGVYIDPGTGEKIPIREAIERKLISGFVVAEADYDYLPDGAYTTVNATDINWDPVSGHQVLAVSLFLHEGGYVFVSVCC